jgi:beta-lactamase regulating signal transducer with metallopeptidase domain
MGFFYSFIETILHSLWQAGMLALIYMCTIFFTKKIHPLQKRNLLYLVLGAQLFISSFTFYFYFTETSSTSLFHIQSYSWLLTYANLLFYIYLSIVCIRFTALLYQWKLFRKNYTQALIKATVEHKLFTTLKAYQLGIKRKVTIWYSHHVQVPITFGFLKPIILLPISLTNNLTTTEIEAIILHELVHIKSKDYLLNWVLVVIEILFFFNPFVKILVEKLKIEREKNCDVQVINFEYDNFLYAEILLKIAKNTIAIQPFQLGAVRNTSQLLKRIRFFCNEQNFAFKKYNSSLLVFIFPIILLVFFFLLPAHDSHKKTLSSVLPLVGFKKEIVLQLPIVNTINENTIPTTITTTPIVFTKSNNNKIVKKEPSKIDESTNEIMVDDLYKNENYYPVVWNEMQMNDKEFIYNIETQKGKVIQSYKIAFKNGKKVLQPQWMLVEKNIDSTNLFLADSLYNVID